MVFTKICFFTRNINIHIHIFNNKRNINNIEGHHNQYLQTVGWSLPVIVDFTSFLLCFKTFKPESYLNFEVFLFCSNQFFVVKWWKELFYLSQILLFVSQLRNLIWFEKIFTDPSLSYLLHFTSIIKGYSYACDLKHFLLLQNDNLNHFLLLLN